MKRARIINAAVWTALATAITTYVVISWADMGLGAWSLIAAAIVYIGCSLTGWIFVDQMIQGK